MRKRRVKTEFVYSNLKPVVYFLGYERSIRTDNEFHNGWIFHIRTERIGESVTFRAEIRKSGNPRKVSRIPPPPRYAGYLGGVGEGGGGRVLIFSASFCNNAVWVALQ